ncbi:unnamed protein product, partial [marine sediment metagenome]
GRFAREYLLNTAALESLNLVLTFAAPAVGTVFYIAGEPTTHESFAANIDVMTVEQVPGPGMQGVITKEHRQPEIIVPISAANTRLTVELEAGGGLVRGVSWMAQGGAAAACLYRLDTIINSVSLEHGGIAYVGSVRHGLLQAMDGILRNITTLPTGCGHIDFSPDGLESQMLDTRQMKRLELVFDVAHPSAVDQLTIWPEYVE